MTEREIFLSAPADASPDVLAAYLDEMCGEDKELRANVEALFAAEVAVRKDRNFLRSPAIGEPHAARAEEEAGTRAWDPHASSTDECHPPGGRSGGGESGTVVENYRLIEEIGRGGFGIVHLAEQLAPVRRRVAFKLVKLGMDTREVIARFETERQALAMMNHPNIARVFDAGATESGRPFFVMELVDGIPITRFCTENGLGRDEMLGLFLDVCSAVQHAHQKGIIHRDLKPTNILVVPDAENPCIGTPKVIDFGIAKATWADSPDATLLTRAEQLLGTPAYMSPEQASSGNTDIDTRSDIYSLGVLLYELLTGEPPFDSSCLLNGGLDRMRRMIAETEPAKPSARLRTTSRKAGDTRATPALPNQAVRPSEVPSDLDWIVMKAMDKDRNRRYETANALAKDLRRFLSHEPVDAAAPSVSYQFRKFIRRHRTAVAAASLASVLLVAGTTVSLVLAWRMSVAEQDALRSAAAERSARRAAQRETAKAERILTFVQDMIGAADPDRRTGSDYTVRQLLDDFVADVDWSAIAREPEVEATLRSTIGRAYLGLARHASAVPHCERASEILLQLRGEADPGFIDSLSDLGNALHGTQQPERTLAVKERALALSSHHLGAEHPRTLIALGNLASIFHDIGQREEALALRRQVRALRTRIEGPDHPDTLRAMTNLALSLDEAGLIDEALELREETRSLKERVFGEDHPETLRTINNLAHSYERAGRAEDALALREFLLPVYERIAGPAHRDTLMAMNNLANSLFGTGDSESKDRALAMRELACGLLPAAAGEAAPLTLMAMKNLALSYRDAGRGKEADALELEADRIGRTSAYRVSRSLLPDPAFVLVPPTSEWRWLHPADGRDPAEQDAGFHERFMLVEFDDSLWSSGLDSDSADGGFGYGEIFFSGNDLRQPENPSDRNSAYFRHRFATSRMHGPLELRCQHDDGIIVYLDGVEVVRDNVEAGPPSHRFHAIETISDGDEVRVNRHLIDVMLRPGDHILAISLHNRDGGSSDLRIGGISLVEVKPLPDGQMSSP